MNDEWGEVSWVGGGLHGYSQDSVGGEWQAVHV